MLRADTKFRVNPTNYFSSVVTTKLRLPNFDIDCEGYSRKDSSFKFEVTVQHFPNVPTFRKNLARILKILQ